PARSPGAITRTGRSDVEDRARSEDALAGGPALRQRRIAQDGGDGVGQLHQIVLQAHILADAANPGLVAEDIVLRRDELLDRLLLAAGEDAGKRDAALLAVDGEHRAAHQRPILIDRAAVVDEQRAGA